MNSIRVTLTALALSAASFAQASEITDFAIEPSTRSRADVQAEARMATPTDEAWSGFAQAMPKRMPAMSSRDAKPATPTQRVAASQNYIGGM